MNTPVIALPPSKSIASRALVVKAIGGDKIETDNISDNIDDIRILRDALATSTDNLRMNGTGLRFTTAFAAATPGCHRLLTGDTRLCERPVSALVDALRIADADIAYAGVEGRAPLLIRGKRLHGGRLDVDAMQSSQTVSALMLIAPLLDAPLEMTFPQPPVSFPYIKMTADMMKIAGVETAISSDRRHITAGNTPYRKCRLPIEADWSAASFFFEALALCDTGSRAIFDRLTTPDVSLQGDARCASLFAPLGVELHGNEICRVDTPSPAHYEADLTENPDLAVPLALALTIRRIPFRLKGLGTLPFKESDRIASTAEAMRMLGAAPQTDGNSITCSAERCHAAATITFRTHSDHRISMATQVAAMYLCAHGAEAKAAEKESQTKSFAGFDIELSKLNSLFNHKSFNPS